MTQDVSPDTQPNNGRITLASLQQGWGGGEVYLSTLALGLRQRGYAVNLIAGRGSRMEAFAAEQNFDLFAVSGRGRSLQQMWQLRRWVRERGTTILHCNDSHALTCAGIATLGMPELRRIAMRHTMFPIRSAAKYRQLADCVIGVSHAVGDLCRQAGIPSHQLQIVHSGIEIPQVNDDDRRRIRTEFNVSDDCSLIVAVGNLHACKGHRILVEATARLTAAGQSVRTVIAGEGPERGTLEELIRKHGLEERVELAGFRSDANALMAAADVVAHPALEEGLCLTVAAALMLQRPVVCTDAGGLMDVTGGDVRMQADGPYADLVPPEDAERMAAAIQQRLNDAPDADRLDAAAEFARQRFSADAMIRSTIEIYHSLQAAQAAAA